MADTTTQPSKAFKLPDWTRSAWMLSVLALLLVAVLDYGELPNIVTIAVKALLSTAPYILFAVLLIGGMKATGSETMISRVFEGREVRAIFLAAVFGGLAPFCSCQVIPFVAALIVAGAPLSAIMAFWLSSPLIDPPTLLITAGALGWDYAIGKAVAAVALGLMGGFAVRALTRSGHLSNVARQQTSCGSCCSSTPKAESRPVWTFWHHAERRQVFVTEGWNNLRFLVKWLAFAYVLEALLITYVPASLVAGLVGGDGLLPIVISAFVGMPAYLNSYIAPPLLAGLTEQGMQAGAAMSFMVAGAISSIPAMTAVYALVVRRVFFLYLGLGVSGAIIAGTVFQVFFG